MIKKIFIVGKVYDMATMTANEIEMQVQQDLDSFVGADKVKFCIGVTDKRVTLIFQRYTDYAPKDLKQGLMKDADAYMITGEGYNGFSMPVRFPIVPFGYSPYLMEQSEFKRAYKESAEILADKINWMKIEVKPYSVVIRLK